MTSKAKNNFFTTLLIIIILLAMIIFFHVFKYSYLQKMKKFENYNIKDPKILETYSKYAKKLNHLRSPYYNNQSSKKIKKEDLFYTKVYSQNKNKIILIQGDSRTEDLTEKKSHEILNLKKFKDEKYNIINAGVGSYSISIMNVQFNVLKNDFNINPDIVVALIDPTDIGDENCRYKDLLVFKNDKLEAVSKSPKGSVYNTDHMENLSFMLTRGLFDIKSSILLVKTSIEMIFEDPPKKKCKFSEIQEFTVNPSDDEIEYFKLQIVNYIKMLEDNEVKKLYLVTYPHIQHIDETIFNIKYFFKSSNLIDKIIEENNFKLSVHHLNYFKKDIFNISEKNYNDFFIKNDPGSHLTNSANNIFFNDILENVYGYK